MGPRRRRRRTGRVPRRRWGPWPPTRPCGCCCWTGPTSRATSPAGTASPRTCSTPCAPSGSTTSRTAGPRCAGSGSTAGDSSVERDLARPVWVIPRRVFDARLVEHATAAGAVLVRHRVRSVAAGPAVTSSTGCTGAGSWSRRTARTRWSRPPAGRAPGRRALAIRGYAPTPPGRRARQVIVYGHRRQPSYAWSFDRGDGLANVGYGELLGDAADPPSREVLLDQLEELLPGTVERRHRLARPPPAALRLALAPARRPGAAGRRRGRAGEPDDRRGHLLRGRDRPLRRPGGGPRPRVRRPGRGRRPAPDGRAPAAGPAPAQHLGRGPALHLARRRRGRDPRRGARPAGLRRPGRDRPRPRHHHPPSRRRPRRPAGEPRRPPVRSPSERLPEHADPVGPRHAARAPLPAGGDHRRVRGVHREPVPRRAAAAAVPRQRRGAHAGTWRCRWRSTTACGTSARPTTTSSRSRCSSGRRPSWTPSRPPT